MFVVMDIMDNVLVLDSAALIIKILARWWILLAMNCM